MIDTAIRVENLGKLYHIGEIQQPYQSLRETLTALAAKPFRRAARWLRREPWAAAGRGQTIWALRDVSLEVKRGEVVGIIGRNGAGKTTLLKILSRITEPTEGRVQMFGRVGSLLEVGTGFHPELTGRENIYLNGAILGMKRAEIGRKFDEIVDFAEIERFIDTPVKRYSSGMSVRLAFAVAAHLEPEILLVDEVLAVGDAAFQKKCLGKMGNVAKEGRTVLFVSHNLTAVSGFCKRGILLESGKTAFNGDVNRAISLYSSSIGGINRSKSLKERTDREGDGCVRFVNVSFHTPTRGEIQTLSTGDSIRLLVEYETDESRPLRNVSVSIPVQNSWGQQIFMCWTRMVGQDFETVPPRGQLAVTIPKVPLREGKYSINLWCEVNGILADWIQEAATFNVIENDFFSTGTMPPRGHGEIVVEHHFSLETARTGC